MTSRPQILLDTSEPWTSSREASLVSRTAQQAGAKAKTTIVTSGPRCYVLFAKSDLAGSWAKTFSASLLGTEAWYSRRCALTWKLKVTPYSRLLFQLQPSALPTGETASGLLRTPSAHEPGVSASRLATKDGNPAEIGKRAYDKHTGRLAQVGLTQQVQMLGLLPTPTASSDAKGGCTRPNGKRQNDTLAHAMHAQTGAQPGTTSQLSPRFVAEMMGFPLNWTELPFQSGATNPSRPTVTP